MKVKTSDLIGPALDWAVAKCENVECDHREKPIWFDRDGLNAERVEYSPSTDWSQGGPIIEQEDIDLVKMGIRQWRADCGPAKTGPTPLIAAMRCYVASKLGDEVKVPEELL